MDLAIEFDIGKVKHRTRNASHEKRKHFSLALEFDKLQTVCVPNGVKQKKITYPRSAQNFQQIYSTEKKKFKKTSIDLNTVAIVVYSLYLYTHTIFLLFFFRFSEENYFFSHIDVIAFLMFMVVYGWLYNETKI